MKLILIISWLAFVSCTFDPDERFMLDAPADLVVTSNDGSSLEAYKAIGHVLQWAVLERARLIKKNPTMSSYFESTDGGFLVSLNFSLSRDTRELLAAKAREKYPSAVHTSQFVDMPLSKLSCNLEASDLSLKGNETSIQLSHMSFAVYFPTPRKDELEKNKKLDNKPFLKCKLLVNGQLESRFSLDASKNKFFISDDEKGFNENQKIKLINQRFDMKINESAIVKSKYTLDLQKE
jgi:hypothetical protein